MKRRSIRSKIFSLRLCPRRRHWRSAHRCYGCRTRTQNRHLHQYLWLLFAEPASGKGGNKTDYKRYDLNVKVNYELGKNDHLFASFFKGNDKAQYTGANALNYGIGFGNCTGTLRWNHLFGDKVFVNTSVIYNHYHLGLNTTQGKYYALLYSEIRDYTAKTMLDML